MSADDLFYLQHILDACQRIQTYVSPLDEERFRQEPLYQDAIVRQLEIIGEAVKHLSDNLRQNYPHVPWKYIAGMRDKLIHHYFRVDLTQVWLTATGDISALQTEIVIIIQNTAP